MRSTAALGLLLLVTACDFDSKPPGPIDPASLPPLSGKEQALLTAADHDVQQGNTAAAEQDYLSAIGVSQGHVEAHISLAKLYVATKQPQKEHAVLEKARELQPNNPGVNYLMGKLDLSQGNNEAALDDFQHGLATVPNDLDLNTGLGIANDMLGQHQAAQRIYLQMIAQHKGENLAAVKTNLGMSYLFTDQPKKTVALLKDEAKKPGSSSVTRYNLALAYGLLGESGNAERVMHGDDDPAARKATLERLKRYINDASLSKKPSDVKPVMAPAH